MKSYNAFFLSCLMTTASFPALAQTVDPALASSWEYAQATLPNISYEELAAACAEGQLTIYQGPWPDAQIAQVNAFMEKFPCINVRRFELQTSVLHERFVTEFQADKNVADIVQHTDPGSLSADAKSGYFAEYKVADDGEYPDGYKMSGYWYPLKVTLLCNAWNTDLVSEEEAKSLAKWSDIADAAWQDRAGVTDAGGVGTLAWYMIRQTLGDAYIEKIAALKPRVFSGNGPAAAALASGDVAVLLGTTETGVEVVWNKGAPVRWVLAEPVTGLASGQAISAKAPHPNAARLYQEYSFGAEGYGVWQKIGGAPARSNFKDDRSVAGESWYKAPSETFAFDPSEFNQKIPETRDIVHRVIGQAR